MNFNLLAKIDVGFNEKNKISNLGSKIFGINFNSEAILFFSF